jgi:hypothetical protein
MKNLSYFKLFEAFNLDQIYKKGLEFTKKLKSVDDKKTEYKHMPCYEYVYLFMKEWIPNLNPSILKDFKMAYPKDILSLKTKESLQLARNSLKSPSEPATMRGLEYVNSKYKLGKIVPPDQAKVGDVISFWIYDLIEFSQKEKNFSFAETEAKLVEYKKKHKVEAEWLIEGAVIKWGHYGIISAVDSNYIYLSSCGEKSGISGIWNGVSKDECSLNLNKILKSDLKKFQNMSYDQLQFKTTDELSEKRVRLILRSYILNFIN